jgi:putative ATPase
MAAMDYGRDYVYPHDQDEHFTEANYFPEEFSPETFYRPTAQGHEKFIRQRLEKLWPARY